jgi:hypothetical protein
MEVPEKDLQKRERKKVVLGEISSIRF